MARFFFIASIVAVFANFVIASPLNVPAEVSGRENLQFLERQDAQFLKPHRRAEIEEREELQYLERQDAQFLRPRRRAEVTKSDGLKSLEREDNPFL